MKQAKLLTILVVLFGVVGFVTFIPEEYEPVLTTSAPTMTINPCSI
jgi:hypothetical protein